MNAISNALIDYWHRLPATPPSIRRRSLEHACQQVRSGELAPDALIPFALADSDEDIVFGAVSQYLDSARPDQAVRSPALDDAFEWVRRHLALNRGAVFAAVLGRGDPALNERLAALRLTLSPDDVATVSRHAPRRPCVHSRRFLRDWLELLAGDGFQREREHLAAALDGDAIARAA